MATTSLHVRSVPGSPALRRPWRGVLNNGLLLVALGLIGFNSWWIWRETRAVPSLTTIRTWVAAKRTGEAKTALREILRRSPHDGEARMELARILGAEKDYLGCAQELHQVPLWWPNKAEAAFLEAQSFKFLDRMREAEAAWKTCNRYDPLHPTPPKYESATNMELMELFAYEERWEDAHKTIWNAYEHADPVDHAAILVMRIRTEMERISAASAVPRLQKYVAADPLDWQARLALARAEQAFSHPEQANQLIARCLAERPDDLRAHLVQLDILHAQGDLDGISAALEKLPKGWEGEAEIWKYRAMAAEKRQDLTGAVEAYREALRLKPFEAEFHYKLSVVEERLGNRELALEHRKRNQALRAARGQLTEAFEKYLDADKGKPGAPNRKDAILRLADLCEKLGWDRVAEGWKALAVNAS